MTQHHPLSSILSNELLIQRHGNGICLMKPEDPRTNSRIPLSYLLDSSIVTFFEDSDSCGVLVNEACASLNSAQSTAELINKKSTHYYKMETALRHIADDKKVIETKSLVVAGEASTRIDDVMLDLIIIKLPWYQGNDIVGVLGLTLNIETNKLRELSENIVMLLTSGIFSPQQMACLSAFYANDKSKTYFSARELDVLFHLVRGKTAKQIGEILTISRRTVENTLARMKEKSYCKTKSELISKYYIQVTASDTI